MIKQNGLFTVNISELFSWAMSGSMPFMPNYTCKAMSLKGSA